MKVTFQRGPLTTAVQAVGAVVPTRTPKAVLQNVKLSASSEETVLLGTDGDIGVRYVLSGADVQRPGEVLLPTRRVSEILRELREETVELEVDESIARIKTAHSEFEIPIQDPAEFPALRPFDEQQYLSIAPGMLRELIRRTLFATDSESTRYALGGILFEVTPNRLGLVATDTRRLALAYSSCAIHGAETLGTDRPIVPAKAMSLIERSLGDLEDDVRIALHPNEVFVQTGPATIYSRLVEGRFPRYQDVVPKKAATTIELICGPLYAAIRQALIMTSDESRGVDFSFGSGKLLLHSRAIEAGNSRVELPIPFDGEDITIRFDPRFIADFLKVLGPERQVTLELNDADSAAVLKTDDGYTYVIMPLQRDR